MGKNSSDGVTWELKPRTRAKHEILRRYLQAWFPIMDARVGKFVYIDGFAGPGEYKGDEPGSPLIALEAAAKHCREITGHAVFIFIESAGPRLSHLKQLLDARRARLPSNFEIYCFEGRFEDKMRDIDQILTSLSCERAPILAFIDPFGYSGAPFWVVKDILGREKGEILVNFAYDSISSAQSISEAFRR